MTTTGLSLEDQRRTLNFGVHPADTDPIVTRLVDADEPPFTIRQIFGQAPNSPGELEEL